MPDPGAQALADFQAQLQAGNGGAAADLYSLMEHQLDVVNGAQGVNTNQAATSWWQDSAPGQAAAQQVLNQTPAAAGLPAGSEAPPVAGIPGYQPPAAAPAAAAPGTVQTQPSPAAPVATPPAAAPATATAPVVPATAVQKDPKALLKEFLESDPNLMLNLVANKLRDNGASSIFMQWFQRNFQNFWGRYQGYVAEQANAGLLPTLTFVQFITGMDAMNAFFADSSRGAGSANQGNTRLGDVVSQGVR